MDIIQKALFRKEKKAFVPYIMAGDGGIETLKEKLMFLQESGAHAIEIGIPFSDPVADGPTIQRAGIRALEESTTLKKVLDDLVMYKNHISVPLILMSYLNPIMAYGFDQFSTDAKNAGVAGCIIPDLPLEEENIITPSLEREGLSLIRLVTLTTPAERVRKISAQAQGFIYAVTVTGITGSRNNFSEDLTEFLGMVKDNSTVPVLAGFGVSTGEQIEAICRYCDGVIVGSKIIDLFEKGELDEIKKLIRTVEAITV